MTQQKSSVVAAPAKAIQWPELAIPPSNSSVKGLTEEQHLSLQSWYLGVKNVVNNYNSALSSQVDALTTKASTIESLQARIAALESAKKVVN